MPDPSNQQVIEALWAAFDRLAFEDVRPLLHDDFVCEWPQSREMIRGRDNFIAVNANYPGAWRITIRHLTACDDRVITEIEARDGAECHTAISFFWLRDGQIVHLREFWPDPYPAPAWRSAWVEQS